MKKIVSYESSDGKLFRDREECANYERTLGLVGWLTPHVQRLDFEKDLPTDMAEQLAADLLRDWSLVRRGKQTKGAE